MEERIGIPGVGVEKILLVEEPVRVRTPLSPVMTRVLVFEQNGKLQRIFTVADDPAKPIRDLIYWAEDRFRKYLAYWMMGLIAVWLILNSAMLYLLNK